PASRLEGQSAASGGKNEGACRVETDGGPLAHGEAIRGGDAGAERLLRFGSLTHHQHEPVPPQKADIADAEAPFALARRGEAHRFRPKNHFGAAVVGETGYG